MAQVNIADIIGGMEQIEADVVVVAWNHDRDALFVMPMWECSMDRAELAQYAARYALRCAEHSGGGGVEVSWVDYRVPEAVEVDTTE